jgi:peptide deformylase
MEHHKGLGIAASQIGVTKQICLIQIPEFSERYGKLSPYPFSVVINPVITVLDENTQGFWEGCLSVPGLRGYVRRPRKIRVKYYNEEAKEICIDVDNMGAVTFQHEVDHLNGILFVDKTEPTKLVFIDQFEKF